MNRYSVLTDQATSAPVAEYARKDAAVKFGESLGVSFQVFSPSGKCVHSVVVVPADAPVIDEQNSFVLGLLAEATNVKKAKAGYARLIAATGKTLAWINPNHVDFPDGRRVEAPGALALVA